MTSPILRSVTVATAGLDLLHATRLKLACSLLLAERIEVQLVEWQEQQVDLLVCGVDDAEGSRAHHVAHARHVNVLAISRQMAQSTVDGVAHGVTVRDLNLILRERLSGASTSVAVAETVTPPPRLLQLLLDGREEQVLTCEGMLVRHQPRTGSLLLPSTATIAQLLTLIDHAGWQVQPTAAANLPLSPRRTSVESLLFTAAAQGMLPGAQVDPHLRMQLRAWPDLDAAEFPASMLMAVACLHAYPWSAAALAPRCGLPLPALQALFAAADAARLARHEHHHAPVAPARVAAPAANDARFLSRLARRLGLRLFETT